MEVIKEPNENKLKEVRHMKRTAHKAICPRCRCGFIFRQYETVLVQSQKGHTDYMIKCPACHINFKTNSFHTRKLTEKEYKELHKR